MSVKKEPSGRHSVEVSVEVDGTPEEVWNAIATGQGVSSWFVPTDIDERTGGNITAHFGPGMASNATITLWDPPHRLHAESKDLGPDAPSLATEWIVETKSGGTSIVRVVHSLFASTDDWDDQLEGVESGWPGFFRILRLYLRYYRGERCSSFRAMGFSGEPVTGVWNSLTRSLALDAMVGGQHWQTPAGTPSFAGTIESISDNVMLAKIDQPAPGILTVFTQPFGPRVCVVVSAYLYGESAPGTVEVEEPKWHAWMAEHFPRR